MKIRLVRFVVLAAWLLSMCPPVSASVSYDTWTGAVSDDWNTGSNWSCGHVPSPNDAAIIPYSGKQPRINTSVTTGSVTINGGGQLIFTTGGALTLNYDFVLNPQGTFKPSSGTTIALNGVIGRTTAAAWTRVPIRGRRSSTHPPTSTSTAPASRGT